MSLDTLTGTQQIVGLKVGGETYGIAIGRVQEIVRVQPVTPVPHAAADIEGVTNLRGKVVPVMDLRRRCGVAPTPPTPQARIVVADLGGQVVGMIVDGVTEIHAIPDDAIDPPDALMSTDDGLVIGVARVADQLVLVLNPEAILPWDEGVLA